MSIAYRLFCRAMFRPTLAIHDAMCLLGLWRRRDWVDEQVALGCAVRRSDVKNLAEAGVTTIVNLCDEFAGHSAVYKAEGIEQVRFPTLDYTCPTEETLNSGVVLICDRVAAGEKLYVHCKAGRTRSATLVLCYLIRKERISAEEAYERLRGIRPQVTRRLYLREPVRRFAESAWAP